MGISSPPVTDFFQLLDQEVFNGRVDASDTYQDLDLSAYVGANAALCIFEATSSTTVNIIKLKPKGYGGVFSAGSNRGLASCTLNNGDIVYLVCFTDESGKIEIGADFSTKDFIIKLVGFVK